MVEKVAVIYGSRGLPQIYFYAFFLITTYYLMSQHNKVCLLVRMHLNNITKSGSWNQDFSVSVVLFLLCAEINKHVIMEFVIQ